MHTNHQQYHDGALLYDLGYLHAGENWAYCCDGRHYIWIGEPQRFGSTLALLHRLVCVRLL